MVRKLRDGAIAGIALILGAGSAVAQTAADATQVWRGRYVCSQGVTGVDLVLKPAPAGKIDGYFLFYPALDNPTVPRGCFTVGGSYTQDGHTRITGGEWVSRPGNYLTIDLDGVIGPAGTFAGRVDGPNCGAFELRLVPSSVPSCEGQSAPAM